MPDLLTHVTFVFIVLTILSWRYSWLRPFISVGMVGAIIPDLVKIHLFLSGRTVETLLGIPFAWRPIHTVGGAMVIAGIGALLFPKGYRRRAFGTLVFGAETGLLLDAGLRRANSLTQPFFYPFSWWQPPSGNLYLSSDFWPAVVTVIVALGIWMLDRRLPRES